MDVTTLLNQLSLPSAYPYPVAAVDVRQTHISLVFLAGPYVYKLKKPVQLGFLDFSTLERRRHFCEEEVRLNRRLAPDVYLGVVPVTRSAEGLRFEGEGEAVEWAVKMRHLPEEATLEQRLARGEEVAPQLQRLAARLAEFYQHAHTDARIAAFGRLDIVAGNVRENFAQTLGHRDSTVSAAVHERVRSLSEDALAQLGPLIEARAVRSVPRDTHGDLRLDHVYLFPERQPPDDVVILDCIEFNERFRFADPLADIAFLAMDLDRVGRHDLAAAFTSVYLQASGDGEGAALLPFYTAYRAVVRAKVEGIKAREPEVPAVESRRALQSARVHWLLALGELAAPRERPCLLLVGGLPGSGKSTLARQLGEQAGFTVLRSDVIRKRLAGLTETQRTNDDLHAGLYSPNATERTYGECLRQAEELLWQGQRVLIDASFREEQHRRLFLDAAQSWGVPALLLVCEAPPEVARQRLAARTGDASDADWRIYEYARQHWEPAGPATERVLKVVASDGTPAEVLTIALKILREQQLW